MTGGIAAIVTAFDRIDQTLATLRSLMACRPAPAEILVHVDGGRTDCASAIRQAFPEIRVLMSDRRVGPGGGRNRLMAAATHEFVASFDDDSYPVDATYFERLIELFDRFPDAAVLDAQVFHRHQQLMPERLDAWWVADFSSGACAYRRRWYLAAGGFMELEQAYGMEEVDLGLRLHALGGRVLRSNQLRVFHDTDLSHHALPEITAASIVNLALLTYLRYPVSMWAIGAGQCLNRVQWLIRHGRRRGVLRGLTMIPAALVRHRSARRPLSAAVVRTFLALRRRPVAA